MWSVSYSLIIVTLSILFVEYYIRIDIDTILGCRSRPYCKECEVLRLLGIKTKNYYINCVFFNFISIVHMLDIKSGVLRNWVGQSEFLFYEL